MHGFHRIDVHHSRTREHSREHPRQSQTDPIAAKVAQKDAMTGGMGHVAKQRAHPVFIQMMCEEIAGHDVVGLGRRRRQHVVLETGHVEPRVPSPLRSL